MPSERSGESSESSLATKTILLVDDEMIVLTPMKLLTQALGYRVLVASSGNEGLEVYKQHVAEICLVITDSVMPGLDGFGLREAILEINDKAKIIILSGYAPDLSSVPIDKRDNLTMLQKPLRQRQLSEAINKMLDTE